MFKWLIFSVLSLTALTQSCSDSDQTLENDLFIEIPESDIYFQDIGLDIKIDSVLFTKESLRNFLDTNKYTGYNDFGYKVYRELFNCNQSDSIVLNYLADPRMALYAFYYLVYEDCKLDDNRAFELINLFSDSKQILQFGIGENVWTEYYLYEAAIDAVLTNVNFHFTEKQVDLLESLRIASNGTTSW